jgi:hypothetical protein
MGIQEKVTVDVMTMVTLFDALMVTSVHQKGARHARRLTSMANRHLYLSHV